MSQFFQGVTAGALPPSVPTQFTTDSGIATPVGNNINIVTPGSGSDGITTSASGSTITITLTEAATEYVNVTFGMSPYTVTATDYFISVDSSGGAITINLPDSPAANRQFIVKDRLGTSAANNITIKSLTGASTIELLPSWLIDDTFGSVECLFHTSNYEIF